MNCPNDCSGEQGGSCEACFKGICDGNCNPSKEGPDCADCAVSYCCGLDTCDPDLCGDDCGIPIQNCGNGTIETGEECDDGGETATCDIDCTSVVCGDGLVNQTANEECDDGYETATCDIDCTSVVCGDGPRVPLVLMTQIVAAADVFRLESVPINVMRTDL